MEPRVCKKCSVEKPLTDFPRRSDNKKLYNRTCKECQSRRYAAWHLTNLEHAKAYSAAYYRANAEHLKTKQRAYRVRANPEDLKAYHATYRLDNPEIIKAANRRHNARKRGAVINDFTNAQWIELQAVYHHQCAYCPPGCKACRNKTHKLTQDHITPLSKGGDHTASNIVPACAQCNRIKSAGAPLIPVQPLLLTVAPPKKTR